MPAFIKSVTFDCSDALAEVRRLAALGASVARQETALTVMRDPEGNEFCVEPGPAGVS